MRKPNAVLHKGGQPVECHFGKGQRIRDWSCGSFWRRPVEIQGERREMAVKYDLSVPLDFIKLQEHIKDHFKILQTLRASGFNTHSEIFLGEHKGKPVLVFKDLTEGGRKRLAFSKQLTKAGGENFDERKTAEFFRRMPKAAEAINSMIADLKRGCEKGIYIPADAWHFAFETKGWRKNPSSEPEVKLANVCRVSTGTLIDRQKSGMEDNISILERVKEGIEKRRS